MARLATLVVSLALIAAGCGDDDTEASNDDSDAAASTTVQASDATTTAPPTTEPPALSILIANDDGVMAEGISVLVDALAQLPNTEVTVSAPAENQSGSGDKTTDGEITSAETTTVGGHPATAVDGTPADAVLTGLAAMAEPPHLVVSGINDSPNIGQTIDLSGTIGAARTGARNGIPAIAVSVGILEPPDFDTAALFVLDWVDANRGDLTGGAIGPMVYSINVPTCPTGEVRGIIEVPLAGGAGDRSLEDIDCESDVTDPTDDLDALIHGFASLTDVPF